MREYIEKRAIELGEYILSSGATVRQCAEKLGVSKSTVHYDVSKRLKYIDYDLYLKVKKVLDFNFGERHLRGGESTKRKYLTMKP